MFGDDPSGMDLMHDTEIIGVGGDVLLQSVGDMLVIKVLISSLGLAAQSAGFCSAFIVCMRQTKHGNTCMRLLTAHFSVSKFKRMDLGYLNWLY